jgi:tripartite-type tricarboxylate transporter receptor subunit TctC
MSMHVIPTWRLLLAAALTVLCSAAQPALAQSYPSRPITIVVPYPAGGVTDNLVRLLAERMKNSLGQSIVIENIGGGGGTIGVDRVSRAAPDGYTLVLGNSESMVFAPVTMAISYNALTDFEPVALLPSYPFLLVTTNDVPAKNLQELIAWFKASPEKVLQGTVGAGTMQQLCGLLLQKTIGTKWQFVPYRGGPPAMQDLLAGQINFMCTTTGGFLPLVHDGRIRGYAVTAKKRIDAAPEIPTANESGLPGFYTSVWNALWVPKGTPKETIAKLNAAVTAGLADPELQKRMTEMGLDNVDSDQHSPEALGALRQAEIDKWWPIIKAAGLKAE